MSTFRLLVRTLHNCHLYLLWAGDNTSTSWWVTLVLLLSLNGLHSLNENMAKQKSFKWGQNLIRWTVFI